MKKTDEQKFKNKWLSIPIIATITRLLCRELTLQNEYLKAENRILKSKIKKRVVFTDEERRTLVKGALALGKDLMKEVVSIVKPETILAWQRRLEKQKWDYSDRRKRNPGRPRISANIEEIVCKMARENMWGYKRIQGELKKLGIRISKTSVANILRRNELPPRSTDLNPYAERFVKSVKSECLDHLMLASVKQLEYAANQYCEYYHHERIQQSLRRIIEPIHKTNEDAEIVCIERLGGLLKSYHRLAA